VNRLDGTHENRATAALGGIWRWSWWSIHMVNAAVGVEIVVGLICES